MLILSGHEILKFISDKFYNRIRIINEAVLKEKIN